jgi:hypothetical protein
VIDRLLGEVAAKTGQSMTPAVRRGAYSSLSDY